MDKPPSQWKTRELARNFLEGVRGAIPGADFQLKVISKIVETWCPQPSRILDLGCGDGILGRMLLAEHPAARVIFVDFSQPMLEAVRNFVGNHRQVMVIESDFSAVEWRENLGLERSLDVVVSGFAIHHQPDKRKKELYAEIYGLLKEGGVFLNLEHVRSATPSGSELFDRFFVDHLLQFHNQANPGKTREEIERAYYDRPDKKENILAPLEIQCQWLRESGFTDVDCFFKVFELALFGGRKGSP
jgi:tRNA (cmo5U34)-methyltransferase